MTGAGFALHATALGAYGFPPVSANVESLRGRDGRIISLVCGGSRRQYGGQLQVAGALLRAGPWDENSRHHRRAVRHQFALHADGSLAGPPGCGFGFDVSQGEVFHATVQSNFPGQGCAPALASFAPFGNWTWTLTGPDSSPETDGLSLPLQADYSAASPGCVGGLGLSFTLVWGSLFDPSVPGQPPHVVMNRIFAPDTLLQNGAACRDCSGAFVVDLAHE